jgi:squalene-hopene/tetraprenyl-beta-curcumene cyclase
MSPTGGGASPRRIPLAWLLLVAAAPQEGPQVGPNESEEPIAREFSLERGRKFLDDVSLQWQRERKCVTCHTNFSYLVTGATHAAKRSAYLEVRRFTEALVSDRWVARGPRWDAEVVVAAAGLAISDAEGSGKLHPLTRKALDRMWTVQKPDGGWAWLKCGWPPMESDDYYGATLALLATGRAPEGYASTPAAQDGVKKVREYLAKNEPPSLHHRGMLLWASKYLGGLMTAGEEKKTLDDLLALQRPDGGWAVATFLPWKRSDGKEQETEASDGYGTGFVIHLARLSGIAAADARIARGLQWIRTHQRESGRWFTRSLLKDSKHFLSHAGTAFAILALHECGETESAK